MTLTKDDKEIILMALECFQRDRLHYGNRFCTQPDDEIDRLRDEALEDAKYAGLLIKELKRRWKNSKNRKVGT